jgi:hypothetical protein
MKYPLVKGQIFVNFHSNCGSPEVVIDGDVEGLRSLSRLCKALADINQKRNKQTPTNAREHIHLKPEIHLGKNSSSLVLGRADEKDGQLNPDYLPRKKAATKI